MVTACWCSRSARRLSSGADAGRYRGCGTKPRILAAQPGRIWLGFSFRSGGYASPSGSSRPRRYLARKASSSARSALPSRCFVQQVRPAQPGPAQACCRRQRAICGVVAGQQHRRHLAQRVFDRPGVVRAVQQAVALEAVLQRRFGVVQRALLQAGRRRRRPPPRPARRRTARSRRSRVPRRPRLRSGARRRLRSGRTAGSGAAARPVRAPWPGSGARPAG